MRKIISSVVAVIALVLGAGLVSAGPASAAADNITAFHGFSSFKGIRVDSQGVDIEGTIEGTLNTYSYEAIYKVYNLPSSSSWKLWVVKFKQDSSQSVLKQTYEKVTRTELKIFLKFKISAKNLRGVTHLRIGFETLRLAFNGTTKDFTVPNPASGGGKDQDNNDIPVDFEPVLVA
ncbi:hypothetical protein [Saccharothrix australiensis]|uniref:Uncharacterized protein n=1 Tax=Saccharothrix australiensis TaxID=2072 RepID=A0A495W1Z6_9PSEU|nr:hypothetical protein [Saccharothrix australiensis]RKT54733.1 hypothetical protein C8E97_3381 [Saccharothrix australiensis]